MTRQRPSRARHRARVLQILATGMLGLGACGKTEGPKPGAPVLAAFDVVDLAGAPVPLLVDGGPVPVSARSHFVLRFDRLIDGDLVEDVTDGGVTGKAGVAVITAPGQPRAAVVYIPNGDGDFKLLFAPGPQLVITPTPTLPSGSTVTVALDKSKIRSKSGEPYLAGEGVPEALTFETPAFAATISAGEGPPGADGGGIAALPPEAKVTVVFNNLPQAAASHIAVLVTDASGQPVADAAAAPTPSDMDPAIWTVAPKPPGWPAGATIKVTVDAAAQDALGMPIAAAVSADFAVQP